MKVKSDKVKILIRATPEEAKAYKLAAGRDSRPVSQWIRLQLNASMHGDILHGTTPIIRI